MHPPSRRTSTAAALLAAAASPALAAPPPLSVPISGTLNPDGTQGFSGFLGNLQRSNYLLGDLFGLRTTLSKYGIELAIQETSEVLGNPTGGVRTGAAYDGLTQAILQLDTQRAFGLYGGLFNISALQIHGRNLSADNLYSLQTASGIESDRATRLWELWYDQKFFPEDRLDIKIGQQSLDQEFISSPNGAYFLNTMFGWPLVPSVDLPGGGPAYPLSDLGIRFRYRPINPLTILVGLFNGSPSPTNQGDAQLADRSGTSFPSNGGQLVFVEMQWSYPAIGSMEEPGQGAPLGHTYRLGAWYDSEKFDDQRYDNTRHTGDCSIYAVADQMVWRKADDPNRSVSLFGRAMGTPQTDRNLVDFSLNAGLVYHDPIINRPDDTLALGMGFAHVSGQVSAADRDIALSDPTGFNPVRSTETYLEATYQYQIHPWWQIQPDMQYVFNPGGGIANPYAPGKLVGDEFVLGIRTNVLF
jgi:porin